MKLLRPLLVAILLVVTFFYITTHDSGLRRTLRLPSAPDWVARPSTVEITEAAEPPGLDAEERNNVEVYRRVLPSVVNITSTAVAFDFFYGPVPQQGQGSGFVFDREGHILTNNHVIAGAREVVVATSDKKKYKARVIGADPIRDLAVIQISAEKV